MVSTQLVTGTAARRRRRWSRVRRDRWGRRAPAGLAALLVLVGLLASGCGGNDAPTAAASPRSGGTLTFAAETEPGCLDPGYDPLNVTALIDRNIFDSLVYQAPDLSFHPWLAERWTTSPDRRTYTFTLRKGVTFHDGAPLTADAVRATLDHAVAPATKSLYAGSLLRTYQGADIVNPTTVAVRLARPDASILQALSTPFLGIQSPRALTRPTTQQCVHPVGSGPFSFVSWTKTQRLALRRNAAYTWGPNAPGARPGAAYLDGITVSFIKEDAARLGALTSGQVNAIAQVPPVSARTVRGNGLRLLTDQAPGGVFTLYLNTTRGPLTDLRVRRALQRGVDFTALTTSVYFGQYARAWSALSPTTAAYDRALENSWRPDPALAGRLLDEAGWTGRDGQGYRTRDGQQLRIFLPYPAQFLREQRDVLYQGIQASARKLGIHLDVVGQDSGTYTRAVATRTADIVAVSTQRAEPDILRLLFGSAEVLSKGGYNVLGLRDPTLDRQLDEAAASSDGTVRRRDYAAVQARVIDQAYAIPIYVPTYLLGTSTRVHGLSFSASGDPVLTGAWLSG
ncbi:Extracellular solute-binding protein family 5 [Frankia canadensis]|uniref:Extracellular solute-binding protein family 5 n=1 Tax=Frankia canadensis TaxID=1836972 RepID=A0A2I2KRR3_9ACTN|nr:ABC transporter substrate-binding protein [Frankia canadensis]SNQ48342.1 Extracellular solute-binding protein family 5 [Frankia canadensis]SOU55632.1 Extracellular solute-binding protein family 5 [Frankia canadensis]